MNHKTYDPETGKEYICENEYDYQIRKFCDDQQFVFLEDEVIDFAFALRDELINDLENKDDTIRLKYIKWIEDEYLLRTKDFLITQNLSIHERLIGFKSFKYEYRIQGYDNRPIEDFISESGQKDGGRKKEPDKKELRKQLQKDYYNLTSKNGFKKHKALDLLEEKYPWKRSTIETYLKK